MIALPIKQNCSSSWPSRILLQYHFSNNFLFGQSHREEVGLLHVAKNCNSKKSLWEREGERERERERERGRERMSFNLLGILLTILGKGVKLLLVSVSREFSSPSFFLRRPASRAFSRNRVCPNYFRFPVWNSKFDFGLFRKIDLSPKTDPMEERTATERK